MCSSFLHGDSRWSYNQFANKLTGGSNFRNTDYVLVDGDKLSEVVKVLTADGWRFV